MYLTHQQRVFRLRVRVFTNRQKFDELQKLGEVAKCRACIRRDRHLRKQLAHLENKRAVTE